MVRFGFATHIIASEVVLIFCSHSQPGIGTITILRVTKGKIALAWKDNDPLFIDKPGMYECKDAKLLWMLWMLLNSNIMAQLF